MTDTYPTWKKIAPGRWESEEQLDGTPDFIATRPSTGFQVDVGWRLKWRSSAQAISGFRTIQAVKDYAEIMVKEMESQLTQNREWIEKHQQKENA